MKILVVDTETDNVKPFLANMLEIAIAGLNTDTGETRLLFDSFVRPETGNDDWCSCWFMQHSLLDPNILRQAPRFDEIRVKVERLLALYPVTAYNLSYDLQVLNRRKVPIPRTFSCLMLTAKDVVRMPGKFGDWKYPKFSESWSYFFPDRPFEEKHRAGYDVMKEAELAKELFARGIFTAPKTQASATPLQRP